MINHLFIQNYALIDELDIDWNSGFSVITGETGSGKSILLGALGLILGQRADLSVLRNREKKCVVEAVFDLSRFALDDFFRENDLDIEPKTTVRREINQSGKSRAFINDTPVKLAQLKTLGEYLVDIHSQHETLNLKNNQFQLDLLDDFAGLRDELRSYRQSFRRWKSVQSQIRELEESIRIENQSRDFHEFQLNELQEAKLQAGEQSEIEGELELLNSAEEIKAALLQGAEMVLDGEVNATALLRQCQQALEPIRDKSSDIAELYDRVKSALIEVKDVCNELDRRGQSLEFNPERATQLQDRIDMIYRLQQKHGTSTVEELIEIAEEIDAKLSGFQDRENELDAMRQSARELHGALIAQAQNISKVRASKAVQLEKRLNELLAQLQMKSAEINVRIEKLEHPDENGVNRVSLLLKANKGHDFMPLENVASGGELSRVMLAVKSVNSGTGAAPTLILDEIDSGVSGKVATAMADMLQEMGTRRQLISITHLAQIAARGQHHYRVLKSDEGEKTYTRMERLDKDGRLNEIAGMLSGFDTTEAAMENARSLMHLN